MGLESTSGLGILRFCTYNLARSRRTREPLRLLDSDVACLSEVQGKRWARSVAASLGAKLAYSPAGWGRGEAILVRPPLGLVEWRPLRLQGKGRPQVLLALITGGGVRFAVGAGRLGDLPVERPAQAEALLAGVDAYFRLHGCPLLLGVDLGEGPGGPAAGLLLGRFVDAARMGGCASSATYRSPRPTARVDYVLAAEGIEVLDCRVPGEEPFLSASTHLPVLATVALPSRKLVSPI